MKSHLNICLIVTLLSLTSCSEKSNVSSPSSELNIITDSTLIFDYSFEVNGVPTLSGWSFTDSLAGSSVSLMNNAPINEGNWSLKIAANPSCFTYLTYVIKPTKTEFNKIYKLSGYIKSSQDAVSASQVNMFVWDSTGVKEGVGIGTTNVENWTNISVSTDTIKSQVDSLVVVISIVCNKSGEQFLFDGIKVMEESYHY